MKEFPDFPGVYSRFDLLRRGGMRPKVGNPLLSPGPASVGYTPDNGNPIPKRRMGLSMHMQMDLRLAKWLGVICLLAGLARMGMTPSAYMWGTDSWQELTFGYTACILMTIGTIGFYVVQARESGRLGLIAALMLTIGNLFTAALVFTAFLLEPGERPENLATAVTQIGGMIGMAGGTLLLAIVTYRARVFPRWVAVLHLVMILSLFLPLDDNKLFALFWGISYVGAGYCIVAGKLNSAQLQTQAGHSLIR